MGCEALLVPDDQQLADGGTHVANSLGCLAIAQLAKANKVPTWVFTETTKAYRDPNANVSCWDQKGGGHPTRVPVSAFMQEAAASAAVSKSSARYPRSEVVPPELISAIITEEPGPDHFIRHDPGESNES